MREFWTFLPKADFMDQEVHLLIRVMTIHSTIPQHVVSEQVRTHLPITLCMLQPGDV